MDVTYWLARIFLRLACILVQLGPVASAEDVQQWSPEITSTAFDMTINWFNTFQFEDSPNIITSTNNDLLLSRDMGKTWNKVELNWESIDSNPMSNFARIETFDYFPNVAMAFTPTKRQFYTFDKGETWGYFDIPFDRVLMANAQINYVNKEQMLFKCLVQENDTIFEKMFYSLDGLKTAPVPLGDNSLGECTFTKINPFFTEGADETILCIDRESNELGVRKDRVIVSTDFFKTYLTVDDSNFNENNVIYIRVENSLVMLLMTTDRFLNDSPSLYTSKDGLQFRKAHFEDENRHGMISILDSGSDALYISRYGSDGGQSQSGDMYKSDSEGIYFKKIFGNVLSNRFGMALVSKVENVDGVWIAAHIEKRDILHHLDSKTKITYDDGKTWSLLNITDSESCSNDEECSLHLGWVTQRSGDGHFVTGETPGIILGVGNVGKYLDLKFENLKTFISRDGGLTWKKVLDYPVIFAFGDVGNVIVSVPAKMEYFTNNKIDHAVDYINYSLDQGNTWNVVKLDQKCIPLYFVNNEDNTDKTFLLYALTIDEPSKSVLFSIDFSTAFSETCTEDQMEEWNARVDPVSKQPVCVFGHSEKFMRRRIDAKCFVNRNYQDLNKIETPCQCTEDDYECNYGFIPGDDGECKPELVLLSSVCDNQNDRSITISSRRKIPGNLCEGGFAVDTNDYKLDCRVANDKKKQSAIDINLISFEEDIIYYQYLEKNITSTEVQDETLFVITASRKAYISFDSKSFDLLSDDRFLYIIQNNFWPDSVYLITENGLIFGSQDRGRSFSVVDAPHKSQGYSSYSMVFEKNNPRVYILISNINCDSSNNCDSYASITVDNGQSFSDILSGARNCIFADSVFEPSLNSIDLAEIICLQRSTGEIYGNLVSSTDRFVSTKTIFERAIGFAVSGNYMVVAVLNEDMSLTAYVSVNGKTFSPVRFPADINVQMQTAYTILDVNSNELFMHLTTFDAPGSEFGALLKANYNGTLFTTAINYVNRNKDAFVDYESVPTLEGISIVNVIMNPEEVKNGEQKKLVSKISYNDAATWYLLPPPIKDSEGKKLNCKGCSLHLHSYTERLDPARDTFSSASALGLMFGLGNVGNYLNANHGNDPNLVSLFFTADSGLTWREVAKGPYIWEFGDQGSILVIVETGKEVNNFKYSLDFGNSWIDYVFSENKYLVEDIATVPSDNSLKFILVVKDKGTSNSIFSVDFTNIYDRQCDFPVDFRKSLGDDYEYFVPQHLGSVDKCLFGHEKRYVRRKPDAKCFVGKSPLYEGTYINKNCECTREDYECDFNFELHIDGTCKLVKGLETRKGDEVCLDGSANEWWEATGYRKIPASTCEGGLVLDKWKVHACPGKKLERNGIGAWAMFWIMFVPFLAFAAALIIVYERGIRRNGGFGRLGEIRLDEGDNLQLIEENNVDKVVNAVIKFGVFSFQLMGKSFSFFTKILDRIRGRDSSYQHIGGMGAFFNDMVDDSHSLFDDLDNDEDAREIESFMNSANHDEFHDGSNNEFDDPIQNNFSESNEGYKDGGDEPPSGEASNSEFRLSEDEHE